MVKDYAKAYRSTPPQPKRGGQRHLLLISCLLLVILSVFYYHYQKKSDPEILVLKPKQTVSQAVEKSKHVQNTPAPSVGFDFYTMLPHMQVQLPNVMIEKPITVPSQVKAGLRGVGKLRYKLQIVSSSNYTATQKLQQRLQHLGLNVQISTFVKNGKTWYRLQSGPYNGMAAVNDDLSRLHRLNIAALLIRAG